MSRLLKSILILSVYCLFTFGFLEIGLRMWHGVPIFSLANFREKHEVDDQFKGMVGYDPDLGWTMQPHVGDPNMGTVEYGIRRNSAEQKTASPGGWLVSGSSFTAGSGADDAHTWPALLEDLEGVPVHNAAIGGFALDQVVLRAESLLDPMKPEILFIDLMQTTISWTGYSVLTRPKPYFVIENGVLKRPVPIVPFLLEETETTRGFRHYAAYSYLADRIMASIDAQAWYARSVESVVNAPGDPIEVSCALLQRIDQETRKRNIRLVIVSIPTGQEIAISENPATVVAQVETCAEDQGLQIVPVRQDLLSAIKSGKIQASDIFQLSDGKPIGHMTIAGNEFVAASIHEALKQPFIAKSQPAPVAAIGRSQPSFQLAQDNLLPASERLNQIFLATESGWLRKTERDRETGFHIFALQGAPTETQSKPIVFTNPIPLTGGRYVLSLEIKPETVDKATILMSSAEGAVITSGFDFKRNFGYVLPAHSALGRDWKAGIEPLSDGWFQISLRLEAPQSDVRIVLGLGNENGKLRTSAAEARALIRKVQLAHGSATQPYIPTDGRKDFADLPGDGINLLTKTNSVESLAQSGANMTVQPAQPPAVSHTGEAGRPHNAYALVPTGGRSEHYLRFSEPVAGNRRYLLTFLVQNAVDSRIRVQMFDGSQNGAMADYDLTRGGVRGQALGSNEKFRADLSDGPDGWAKISLSIPVVEPDLVLTFQSLDAKGNANFAPDEEKIVLSDLRLEAVPKP